MLLTADRTEPNRVTTRPYRGFAHRRCPCGQVTVAVPTSGIAVGCPVCHRRLIWKDGRLDTLSHGLPPGEHR